MFHTYKQHDIFEVNLPYGQSGFMVNPGPSKLIYNRADPVDHLLLPKCKIHKRIHLSFEEVA